MRKINLNKKICLFLIALLGYTGMKAQTCGSAITLTANTGFTAVDSTNINLTYYKFTATNTEHGIKFFIKNSNSVKAKCQFKCYTNNCGSLPTSEITSIVSTLGDTFYVDLPSVSTGTVYLIELRNFTPSYLVNRISITNTRYSSRTTNSLSCSPSCTTTNACNMVCNGSFECQSGLPPFPTISGIFQGYANNWNCPTGGTADLFSTSFPFTGWVQSPCNVFGNQSPQNGNSYAGIIWADTQTDDYTEYIQTQLTNSLSPNVPYTCSMWVRAGDINQAQLGNSQLGIYLTSGPLSISNYTTIPLTPNAVETNTTNLNTNTVWKKITLTFTATGGEDYLTIGRPAGSSTIAMSQFTFDCSNFSTAPTTSYVTTLSYLYIDNVSLVPTLTVSANANFPVTCSGANVNLTATSNIGGTTFTWQPGNLTGSSVNVTPTVTTTYTLLASVSGCSATSTASTIITVTVMPQVITTSPNVTICPTYSAALSASASVAPATFTWMPGSLTGASIAVTPTVTTIYTVTGTSANGCSSTKTLQVTVIVPPGSFSVSASTSLICTNQGQSTSTLTATGTAGLSYTWNPGVLNGAVQTVTPSSTTIYTATALSGGCVITNTLAIAVQSACCTSTYTSFNGIVFPSTPVGITYMAPIVFNNDVTVPPGQTISLSNTEYLFAPNVKIIVSPGAVLQLRGCHLYACGTNMWQGIVIQDGGAMNTVVSGGAGNHVLIEDAITAVDITNNTTSTLTTIASLVTTIFNKNYIGVKVDNYQRNFVSNPVYMKECVFSSRQFTFTPTSWPSTSEVSPGLRSTTNPTTGLAAPYTLQSAGLVYLKAPYSNQPSRIGVQVINSGITSGSNYYGIDIGGVTTNASDFNLFDNLMWGIDATNSNISSINNVFQNAQRIYFCPRCYYDGGTAIRSTINTNLNARVNMTAVGTNSTSYSLGNRFWDCYRAVEATNVYRLNCNYATFRSTQTTASATNPLLTWGSYGITNATNRFEHDIRYNNFNNINNPIAITVAPGTYTYGVSTYSGILANNILIDYNYFGAQLTNGTAIGTAFLNNAVYLGSSSSAGWHNIAGLGLRIANNEINRAWRGVYVDAFGYPTLIQTNTVTLLNDATIAATQRGISANANVSAATTIANNKLTGVNTTNTLVTLVYVGASPVSGVTCNSLSTSYQGFEFNSSSSGSTWKGNDMTNHARGMVLSNNGIIGTQGASGAPSDNRWWGSWTGGNYGTYVVDLASDAANSKLWVQNAGVFAPQNPSGFSFFQSYAIATNTPNTTGTYSCGSPAPPAMMMMPASSGSSNMQSSTSSNVSAEELYIAENTTYRYLDANPSVKNSNTAYVNFYNAKTNSSMDKFKQVEANLYSGQIAQAASINNAVSVVNAVEGNYKSYYTLYVNYKNGNFTSADSATLINLAKLCPGMDGSIIYQARALYNLIYKTANVYTEDCNTVLLNGSRLKTDASSSENLKNNWNVELFPNPTKGNFTLVSKAESEMLTVTITDIAGKLIYSDTVNTSNFIVNLDLNAKAGVYLINIKNTTNESITKKLVITD